MNRFLRLLLLLCLPAFAGSVSAAVADSPAVDRLAAQLAASPGSMMPVIIAFRHNDKAAPDASRQTAAAKRRLAASRRRILSGLETGSYQVIRDYDLLPLAALRVNRAALEHLALHGDITGIFENKRRMPLLENSVPMVNGDRAWELGYGGEGLAIAVIDNGVDRDHPMLAGKVVAEACFSTGDAINPPRCPDGSSDQRGEGSADVGPGDDSHGTHVAAIAAGRGGNGYPDGVARDADIVAVRVDSDDLFGETMFDSDILAGLDYVYNLGRNMPIAAVNLSLGGDEHFADDCDGSSVYTEVFERLRSAGIVPVVAAGNEYQTDGICEPACVSSAVAVGAVDGYDQVWSASNSGRGLDLLAPGVNIVSADIFTHPSYPPANLVAKTGTSMATPHVAGVFTLIRSLEPAASVDTLEAALKTSGVMIQDHKSGIVTPRIDAEAALYLLDPSLLPPPDPCCRSNPAVVVPFLEPLLLDGR